MSGTSKRLSPSEIFQLAWKVRDGEAKPEEAKALMEDYCQRYEKNEDMPHAYYKYIYDAFSSYLTGDRSIEAALGLSRGRKGRSKKDESALIRIAADVLRHRMAGLSAEKAVSKVTESENLSETQVWDAWRYYKMDAIISLRNERPIDQYPWSDEEVQKLTKIFKNNKWFIPPEN